MTLGYICTHNRAIRELYDELDKRHCDEMNREKEKIKKGSIKKIHGVCGGDIELWNYVMRELSTEKSDLRVEDEGKKTIENFI